jgi:hypothetical protein
MLDGLLHARRGERQEVETAVQRALALTEDVDFHFPRSMSRALGAEAFALVGRREDAERLAAEALQTFAAKGDVTGEAQFLERFVALGIEVA